MKTKNLKGLVMLAICLAIAQSNYAQFVIKFRPSVPRVLRVVAPSPRHVWIEEDWEWQRGQYVSRSGYWAAPPRNYAVWKKGHWKHTRRGWIWKHGYWR
jgi:hypothetical protein